MPDFKMDDYIDVAERIREFREMHPNGSLQQLTLDFREVAGQWWVIFTAAAYRSPDDERPGHGTAWEPVPGRTPFTKGSEVQNAETAAWGRAIVAALAGDTKRGVASAQEVRNRNADRQAEDADRQNRERVNAVKRRIQQTVNAKGLLPDGVTLGDFVAREMVALGLDPDVPADLVKLAEDLEGK